ncbi:MAG: UvrD-helicase domain-containing protein [Patescibacteria group bacterium]|nr:UvrD-helicase domain-containing protein [Patescibacteria group bacterium]
MSLLKNLNPEQLAAVKHRNGPLLIVAGAGTGKTTVITQRLALLIEEGLAKPEEILALTFTEKAAGEMAERVDALLPYGYFDLWISTFHGFCERVLKEHGLAIGLPTDFKLLNEFEQWALVKKNLDKFDLDYYRPLGNPAKFIRALIKHFSRAKDEDIAPADYLAYAEELKQDLDQMLGGGKMKNPKSQIPTTKKIQNEKSQIPNPNDQTNAKRQIPNAEIAEQEAARLNEVANAYHVYQQLLLDNNALDFGDLINYCLKLFRTRPAILEQYQRQFKYILLDEFQDTNWAQYELVKILAAPQNNLTVVGDDDQAIFRFRGASMSNILQFMGDFPQAEKIILTKNYRSRQNILDLAYEFIKLNNPNRLEWQLENTKSQTPNPKQIPNTKSQNSGNKFPNAHSQTNLKHQGSAGGQSFERTSVSPALNKKLIAADKGQADIKVLEGADLAEEVKLGVDKIVELKRADKTATWNDFAILVRANDSARDFIAELARRGAPYIFGAARGLYFKPVIMDAIAYFKLLDNYHESAAVWRMLNLPIYDFTSEELINLTHLAGKKAWSLYEVLKEAAALKLSAALQKKIEPALAMIAKHATLARQAAASQVLAAFLNDSGYLKYLVKQADDKGLEAINFLNQFLKRLQEFESAADDKSVKAFLAELALELEAGEEGGLAADLDAGPEAVKILTAHGAKGLEFKYVFIANLVDKRFPTIERSEEIALPDALVKEILPQGDAHLEEERRLFYVAMTRARVGLYFSWARDYGGRAEKKPSRFLAEAGLIKKSQIPISKSQFPNPKSQFPIPNKTPNSKPQIILQIPSHFSYSQLAAYSNCPYQYRFAHILKIPTMGKEQFSFGKTMHATLQKLFALIKERQGMKQADLFSGTTSPRPSPSQERGEEAIAFAEILKLYEQSWIDDWYDSKAKKQARKKQGEEILKVFYEKYHDRWPEVLFLEKGFNLKIAHGQAAYGVRGVIDRVDQTSGGLKLVDYKTGQPKKKLSFADKEQLFIYQLAAEQLFQEPVAGLAYYYLEDNSEIEFIGGPKELAKIKEKIISTIKAIKDNRFPPQPGRLCAWCDFNGICEYHS